MSRFYYIEVNIHEVPQELVEELRGTLLKAWTFTDIEVTPNEGDEPAEGRRHVSTADIRAYGEDSLCGGLSDEDFSKQLVHKIWAAAKQYLETEVRTIFMENLPTDIYNFEQDEYEAFLHTQKNLGEAKTDPPPS